jgi:hypothetical protein
MSTNLFNKLVNLGIVVLITGCASGAVFKIESRLEPVNLEKFKKMFVVVDVESRTYNSNVSNSMQKQLAKSLSDCGTSTYFFVRNDLDSNPEDKFKKEYAEFNPDSYLKITKTEGEVKLIDGGPQRLGKFTFIARISQTSESPQVWAAKGDVGLLTGGLFDNDKKSGEIIANEFFKKMAADGLVCNR